MYKPSRLEFLTKSTAKKTRRDEHVRLRALNGLLYKALTELLCTPQVSQEICDLNVQLSKVSLTADFSACRVYWRTEVPTEQNASTEAVLQRSAAHMRHLLMSQQTLRNVPPIVFIRDKGNAALAEVTALQELRARNKLTGRVRCCSSSSDAGTTVGVVTRSDQSPRV